MRLAIFDDYRLGVVSAGGDAVRDVTGALPWPHDPDPVGAGWWVRLCRAFPRLRAGIGGCDGPVRRLDDVRLRAPVLRPGKIVGCASNYADHVREMRDDVLPRLAGPVPDWLLDFGVFLKAPSSVAGPGDEVRLPTADPAAAGAEVHHEGELAVVIGAGGADIAPGAALDCVLGYTIGIDVTVRGPGDRSRRKSYDTFTPLGPWLVTADEVGDPQRLDITLRVDGEVRQAVSTADMLVGVRDIVAATSRVMRLEPGDVILTGAPPGVGPIRRGEVVDATITGLGHLRVAVA